MPASWRCPRNLNGSVQAVKTSTAFPGMSAKTLIEEPFRLEGFSYLCAGIVKEKNRGAERRTHVTLALWKQGFLPILHLVHNAQMGYNIAVLRRGAAIVAFPVEVKTMAGKTVYQNQWQKESCDCVNLTTTQNLKCGVSSLCRRCLEFPQWFCKPGNQ